MNRDTAVLLIEFNELCPALMERFIGQNLLPNFARLRDESDVFITEAEERAPYLDPWIQWITVHAGVNYEQHGIEHLNEAHKIRHQFVWDILSKHNHRVWVCGSMSVSYNPGLNGIVLPDPWTTKISPYPADLAPFFQFIQQHVMEYSNERVPLSPVDYAAFAAFMVRHGLSMQTVRAIVEQLAEERLTGRGRWKRATLLDKLQFDVFRHYYERDRPKFATFFSNSTAHFQHLYWRHMDPDLFSAKPAEEDRKEYGEAILYGYKAMDSLLADLVDLAGPSATIVFATALSQQPFLKAEDIGGRSYYRPKDFRAFARALDLPRSVKASPVMAHEFYLDFDTEEEAALAERRIASVEIMGQRGIATELKEKSVLCGSRLSEVIPSHASLRVGETGGVLPFYDVFYKVNGTKSGMHHPSGLLWIRRPDRRHRVAEAPVPLASIAPTLLDMFSIPPPEYMTTPKLNGFSRLVR